MNILVPGTNTLSARLLLGWMEQEEALRFLCHDCVFDGPLSSADANRLWLDARSRVESLPPLSPSGPRHHKLNSADHKAIQEFRRRYARATDVIDFLKLDPRDLLVHQFFIVNDLKPGLDQAVAGDHWLRTALLDGETQSSVRWHHEPEGVVFDLPHGEYFLAGPRNADASLQLLQRPQFATVTAIHDRFLLANGYHRAFARAFLAPGEPTLFAASIHAPFDGTGKSAGFRARLSTPRPPCLGDFFAEGLYLPVRMKRHKGYQLRIRTDMVPIYDDPPQLGLQ